MNELDIFSAALEIKDLDGRRRYLDQACSENSQIRNRVEELLGNAENGDSFMELPPQVMLKGQEQELTETHDLAATERIGDLIGPFKLLQKLGQGGMGTVFLAEQKEPVKRRVALKIVKPGMDSRAVIARFEAERQALSMMEHPNIARALDAGTLATGRPYFVMELVKGIPITRYCDEHKLTTRERLRLFIPVCHAVQHAHQKGIVHRDLKPSNILVTEYDEKAVPKVIDFGIAKALHQPLTEKTLFTQIGQIVGTIQYMSPEQAKVNELDVDIRSDIYSLGVVLYELLAGTTPHEKDRLVNAAWDELIKIIRDEDPPVPSKRLSTSETVSTIASSRKTTPAKLSALVRGELDWIAMKSLDKDRSRRYQSCGEFADDINRYLNAEQVLACPPTPVYRLKKFVRRNVGVVLAVSAVIAALAIGLTVAVVEKQKTQVANQKLKREKLAVQKQANLAWANEERNRQMQKKHLEFVATLNSLMAKTYSESGSQSPELKQMRSDITATILDHFEAAIGWSREVYGDESYPTTDYRIKRASLLAQMGDHEGAFREVVTLTSRTNNLANRFAPLPQYAWSADLARICSRCANTVGIDDELEEKYVELGRKFAFGVLEDIDLRLSPKYQGIEGSDSSNKQSLLSVLVSFLDDPVVKKLDLKRDSLRRFKNLQDVKLSHVK